MGVDMLLLDSQVCYVPLLEFITALTVVKRDEDVKVIVAVLTIGCLRHQKFSELKCSLYVEEDELMSFTKIIVDAMQEAKVSASNEAEISQTFSEAAAAQVDLRSLEL
ncbi:hypothetical protein HID58_079444 [Brassica napus]|uniref:Uncharacterized protein n=1 Tax=Brassica napus TaxID=3708 RepID=A0ABQ7Y217_BRANA|nr:hypothetical protein HID58_079444 [Brassica napus]